MSNDTPIKVQHWYRYIRKHPSFTGCLVDRDGDVSWYKNGEAHREDGPAVIEHTGCKYWALNGEEYSEREHSALVRQMKLKLLDIGQHSI
jgi:hypothetical protein